MKNFLGFPLPRSPRFASAGKSEAGRRNRLKGRGCSTGRRAVRPKFDSPSSLTAAGAEDHQDGSEEAERVTKNVTTRTDGASLT